MKIRGWQIVPISPKANNRESTESLFSHPSVLSVFYQTSLDFLQ